MTRSAQSKNDIETGEELLTAVRSGFVANRTTMNEWCLSNGVATQNARVALLGGWRGPKARVLIEKITKAAGVELPQGRT